jgi:hypothetical protein
VNEERGVRTPPLHTSLEANRPAASPIASYSSGRLPRSTQVGRLRATPGTRPTTREARGRGRLHGPNLSRQLQCASRNRFAGRQRTWYIRPLSLSRTIENPVPSLTLPEGSLQPAQHRGSGGESMGYGSRRPMISGPLPCLRVSPANIRVSVAYSAGLEPATFLFVVRISVFTAVCGCSKIAYLSQLLMLAVHSCSPG